MSTAAEPMSLLDWGADIRDLVSPLVVSYGMGVDSTAMLVGMAAAGVRPDAIVFADVGSEKPETYAYGPVIDEWLARVGFPARTVVRYPGAAPRRRCVP